MILYPAIDLKDGKCVRLIQGDMNQSTVFADEPADQARKFEADGASWLHIVDLNGAFAGKSVNGASVTSILEAVGVKVQLGGGIRDMFAIESWLDCGINRVILGTAAVKNPTLVRQACKKYPEQIAVGIDARGGKVAVEGWAEESEIAVIELAKRFEDAGVAAIIYTNIDRDGVMKGPDIEGTKLLAEAVAIPIIASGGVSSIEDLMALKKIEASGVQGAICGRALYDGRIQLKQALTAMGEI